jgi:hypothetical protein
VTWHPKTGIMEPEEIVCCMVSAGLTLPRDNGYERNNRRIVGNGVLCAVRAEAIERGRMRNVY